MRTGAECHVCILLRVQADVNTGLQLQTAGLVFAPSMLDCNTNTTHLHARQGAR
jgi:hypothetical protein